MPWTNVQCQDPVTAPQTILVSLPNSNVLSTQSTWYFSVAFLVTHGLFSKLAIENIDLSVQTAQSQSSYLQSKRSQYQTILRGLFLGQIANFLLGSSREYPNPSITHLTVSALHMSLISRLMAFQQRCHILEFLVTKASN